MAADPDTTEFHLEEHLMPTIKVTKRTDRSMYMFVMQHCIKPFKGHIIKPHTAQPPGSQQLEPHKRAKKQCHIQEREVEGYYVYDMVPHEHLRSQEPSAVDAVDGVEGVAGEKKPQRKRIYYFAGGGWQMPPSSEHWVFCAEMAKRLPDAHITVVSYPLAPHSPAPTAFPSLLKLYHTLLRMSAEANERVVLAGDSAGGNIILSLTLVALNGDPEAPAPAALMAISPSTDLRRHNSDIKVVAKHDPILSIPFINNTAKRWRGDMYPCDPRVSPLYADVRCLARRGVQVHGVVGRYDILGPDAVLFREKLSQAFVSGEWLDWEKQMHVFPLTWSFKLPEGVQSKEWIIDVLRRA